ncbi:MAG: hypothetical protein IPJ76_16860 [Flavobacteriales bacterium]|nr:MAG: hypothetical protein IPJ76_16860 [Flavobacteriales bacterium]
MKKSLGVALLMLSLTASAQFDIGTDTPKKEWEDVLTQFKGTTTIFFLRSGDARNAAEWETALKKAWTLTPLEVHPLNDFGKYTENMKALSGYSFITITPVQLWVNGFVTQEPRMEIWLPWAKSIYRDNVEQFKRTLGYSLLDISIRTANWDKAGHFGKMETEGEILPYLYSDAEIRNWTPQLVASSLKLMSIMLSNGERKLFFNNIWEEADYRAARTDSLFVRADMMETWDIEKEAWWFIVTKDKNLALTCPKDVRVLSAEELERKLASNERFQFVTAIRSGRSQIIMVQNSWDSEVIYLDKDYHLQSEKMWKRLCTREKL